MKEIIPPVDRTLLKRELSKERFVRPTNKAGNEIYDVTAHNSPNIMREIGRLREMAFRSGGGGTGEEIDIDSFDTMATPYHQLIVWDPEAEEIIGGYRYLKGTEITMDSESGEPNWVSSHMFHFSDTFVKEYLCDTIELGRAFVQPMYQTAAMKSKGLFALDNLWDGLGAIVYQNSSVKYLIGKVTIYREFNELARELIYAYFFRYFPDNDNLITAIKPLPISENARNMAKQLFKGDSQSENYKRLQKAVRELGEHIPPLINAYVGLSSTMKTFGCGVNFEFGDVYETGIMITIPDLFEEKRKRYIDPYIEYLNRG